MILGLAIGNLGHLTIALICHVDYLHIKLLYDGFHLRQQIAGLLARRGQELLEDVVVEAVLVLVRVVRVAIKVASIFAVAALDKFVGKNIEVSATRHFLLRVQILAELLHVVIEGGELCLSRGFNPLEALPNLIGESATLELRRRLAPYHIDELIGGIKKVRVIADGILRVDFVKLAHCGHVGNVAVHHHAQHA